MVATSTLKTKSSECISELVDRRYDPACIDKGTPPRLCVFVSLLGVFQAPGSCLCGAGEEEERMKSSLCTAAAGLFSHFNLCFYMFVSFFETNGVWGREIHLTLWLKT